MKRKDFKHNYQNCPDDVDTEDKEIFEMPVEDFGMAMLRGMGWNPKKKVNTSNGKNGRKMQITIMKMTMDQIILSQKHVLAD